MYQKSKPQSPSFSPAHLPFTLLSVPPSLPSAPPPPPALFHLTTFPVDMNDKEILKYTDVVLRASDLDTLQGPCFLNDQIIAFYFSYLSASCKTDDVLLVKPSISLWLANCKDDETVKDFAESLKLASKRLVLFAINDNTNFDGGDSGNHWSILVYDRTKNAFLHFDSMEGVNNIPARKLYDAVKLYMGPGGEVSKPNTSSSSSSKKQQRNKKKNARSVSKPNPECVNDVNTPATSPVFEEPKTPQQSNGYDCGLYVLAIARTVCQWYSHHVMDSTPKTDVLSAIEKHVDGSVEIKMRSEVLAIIQQLSD